MSNTFGTTSCDIGYSAMLLAISEAGIHPKNSRFNKCIDHIFFVEVWGEAEKLIALMSKIGDMCCVYNPPDPIYQKEAFLIIDTDFKYLPLTEEDIKKIEDAIAKYCLVK
ncbi:MAG: hypothetical protein LC122_13645 [Chitinophagales bacterium]|nr:hypothetical protein [Chitinophagales bacterium]